jgi:hypothetical protein
MNIHIDLNDSDTGRRPHEVNITLIDGRIMNIAFTDEGIIWDLFDNDEDADPHTMGMLYDEWADFIEQEGAR